MATEPEEVEVKRAILALQSHPSWRVLRDALHADRERLRRQLENLPLDATMEQVRYLAGQMRGLSLVIDKPQRVNVVERTNGYVRVVEEVR